MAKTIAVSGGFDPLHADHVRMFEAAAEYGNLIVILNSDDWLIRKKGFFHQAFADRAYIIGKLRCVASVMPVEDADGTVLKALIRLAPDYFGNGGDRFSANTPEEVYCQVVGIKTIYGLGACNRLHSSVLFKKSQVARSWGHYTVLDDGPGHRIKRLTVLPHKRTSLQRHFKRKEILISLNTGEPIVVDKEQWHIIAADDKPLEFVEVQIGDIWEGDIERDEDSLRDLV